MDCENCPHRTAREELGREIAWAGGWQEFYQTKDKNPEMEGWWTRRYNELRKEYFRLYGMP